MIDTALGIALVAGPAIAAIILHELAHGWAALALGDDTARRMGRLSPNPVRHVDPLGTLLLPGFLVVSQMLTIGRIEVLFGWAKPVPINPWVFANPRRGMAVVAAAGPAINLLLAWLTALSVHALPGVFSAGPEWAAMALVTFWRINVILALFNLIPIPPLDGGRILVGVLPVALARPLARIDDRAGLAIVMLGLFLLPLALQSAGVAFDPLRAYLGVVLPPIETALLWLAGHGGG